jgi:GH24 family phage-related lysozyme (muramidase)
MLSALEGVVGITGSPARSHASRLKNVVDISWDQAMTVHKGRVIPRWVAKVERLLPNAKELSDDCLGALVSLVFNRGPGGFTLTDDRYREMRNIKAHVERRDFTKIPQEIRNMKRLWPGSGGLLRRRDEEAKFFQEGL